MIGLKRPWLWLLAIYLIVAGCTGVGHQPAPEDQTVPIHNDTGGGDSGM